MNFRHSFFGFFTLVSTACTFAQESDSLIIRKLFNEALLHGKSHDDLRYLCKSIGHRLSGSPQAQLAVEWGKRKMEEYGLQNVQLQPIMVPRWERGRTESAWFKTSSGELTKLDVLALGGSINTNGLIRAEVIQFNHLDDLKKATRKQVEGKIVFLNQPMNAEEIMTFTAYNICYPIRGHGADESSTLGAVAVAIRSLALPNDDHPHTGTLRYDDKVKKIPACALSTNSSNQLAEALTKGRVEFLLEMDCRILPDVQSYNVIGEITGSSKSNEIITIGGHLDSWDTGEGAHDDGAGIMHCLEALRILKKLNITPKHTIRVVFFMNEENGNRGGEGYAEWVKKNNELQIATIESDRGGFTPQGFECDGTDQQLALIQSFKQLLAPYGIFYFKKGYGGVDINPLKQHYKGIPLYGFVPDSQRYFDVHHSPNDVFETVNKRELELGCATMAAFIYLLDKSL
jgi:hypothetical protein